MSNLAGLLRDLAQSGRVCPAPQQWQRLYDLLPAKQHRGHGWEPPLPLILGAWWHSSDEAKQARLREHLEWAELQGCLDAVPAFLQTLTEDQWHHRGEQAEPSPSDGGVQSQKNPGNLALPPRCVTPRSPSARN